MAKLLVAEKAFKIILGCGLKINSKISNIDLF